MAPSIFDAWNVGVWTLQVLIQVLSTIVALDIYKDTKDKMGDIEELNMQLAEELWASDKRLKAFIPDMYAVADTFPTREDCETSLGLRKNSVFQVASEKFLPGMQMFGKGLIGMKKYQLRMTGVTAAAETSARMGGAKRFEMMLSEAYEKDRVLALASTGSNARYAFGIPGALRAAGDGYTGLNALAAESIKGSLGAFSRSFHERFGAKIEWQDRDTTKSISSDQATSDEQRIRNALYNIGEKVRFEEMQKIEAGEIIEEDLEI